MLNCRNAYAVIVRNARIELRITDSVPPRGNKGVFVVDIRATKPNAIFGRGGMHLNSNQPPGVKPGAGEGQRVF